MHDNRGNRSMNQHRNMASAGAFIKDTSGPPPPVKTTSEGIFTPKYLTIVHHSTADINRPTLPASHHTYFSTL